MALVVTWPGLLSSSNESTRFLLRQICQRQCRYQLLEACFEPHTYKLPRASYMYINDACNYMFLKVLHISSLVARTSC